MCSNQAQAYFNNIPFRFDFCSFEFLFHVMQLRKYCFVSIASQVHSCIFRYIIENLIPFFSLVLFCHPTNSPETENSYLVKRNFMETPSLPFISWYANAEVLLMLKCVIQQHSFLLQYLPVQIKFHSIIFFVKTNQFLILCIFPDS